MHSSNVDEFTHISLTIITSTKVQMLSIDNTTLTHQQKDCNKKHEIHMDWCSINSKSFY